LYFSYIKDNRGTIEVKQAIFETIQNLYIKGKVAGKPMTNKLTILPNEKNKNFSSRSNYRRSSKLVWDQSGFVDNKK